MACDSSSWSFFLLFAADPFVDELLPDVGVFRFVLGRLDVESPVDLESTGASRFADDAEPEYDEHGAEVKYESLR